MSVPERPSLREKFCYGFGDLASVLYFQTFMVYLTYFYTDVFGIAAAAAGAMIGLSRTMDAFFNPIMGMIADRTQTRWGKFRPFLVWFCVPLAVMGVLTFTVPDFDPTGKLVWAYVTYNCLMLFYAAINIPYTAMMGVISQDPNDRTFLASAKFVGAFAAGILISATLLPMTKILGGANQARGWQLSFVVVGVAAVFFFLATFFNTRERVVPQAGQKTSVLRDLADLVTNLPWLLLTATTITFIVFVGVRSSVTVHYFKYYVGTQTITLPSFLPKIGGTQLWHMESLVSMFNTSNQMASLLGVVMVPFFAKITGRKVAFVTLFLIAIASTGSFYFFKPDQLALIFGVNLLGSITGGPLSALLWSMYADTADFGEWKRGRRATGLVFSASLFAQSWGWAIGAWIALTLLQSDGFVANVAQNPGTLHGLVQLMSLIPASIGILAVLLIFLYPLNEARMAQIAADLKARRESTPLTDRLEQGHDRGHGHVE
jgi:GPH family glycoside/pentoside/hexuronide:cation symporter